MNVLNLLRLLFILFVFNVNLIGQSTVQFIVKDLPVLQKNQKLGIRGNLEPLTWDKSILLSEVEEYHSLEINFQESTSELEFKFVIDQDGDDPIWEGTQNRTLKLDKNNSLQISESYWDKEQIIDISKLEKIDVRGLQEDFELIKAMVLNVHPGTYRYNSKEEIKASLEILENKFSQPLSHQDAYLAISQLTAQLKCDHTKAGFNNQGKVINSIIHKQADKIPFTFQWFGEEMIVLENASSSNLLNRGVKVHTINGIKVSEIRSNILQYIGADGATDKNRIYKIQVNGYDFRYNAFDIFYALLYPVNDQKLTLEVQQPESDIINSINISALTREDRFQVLSERYHTFPKSRDDMWKFEVYSDSIAILTLNSFGLNGWKAMTIDYKAFLEKAFKILNEEKIPHLVIDIRENTGGMDEMADELYSYLTDESFNFEREGRTRFIAFPELLKSHVKTWGSKPWYYNLNPEIKSPTNGYYIFKENFSSNKKVSDKNIYKGKTYLLTSAANTSLAFYTAYRFKNQNIGTVIGEETGGNLNDINGGQILFLNLPNSGIEIDFPIMGGFSNITQPDSGVIPDVKVTYSVDDIINETDLELLEVLKIVH